MQKSETAISSSTSAMFPAYERVVLREGDFYDKAITNNPFPAR